MIGKKEFPEYSLNLFRRNPQVVAALQDSQRDPGFKAEILGPLPSPPWSDRDKVLILEFIGEEDRLIGAILSIGLGWDVARIAQAFRDAGWQEQRAIGVMLKLRDA